MRKQNHRHQNLLFFYEAPAFLKSNPFILSGYRGCLSIRDCAISIFKIHNETVNIWTHIVGVVLFGLYLLNNHTKYDPDHRTMFYMSVGACILCYLTSCVYHTFNCHSQKLHQTLLYCDFAGIVLTIAGVTAATVFYILRCFPFVRDIYVWCCVAFGVLLIAVILSQSFYYQSRFGHLSHYFLGVFCIFGLVPLIHWAIVHGFNSPEVNASLWKIILAYLFLALGFLIWKFHIPERWLIGQCDIWFSSHQLWHIMVMLGPAFFLFAGHDALLFAKHNPCA